MKLRTKININPFEQKLSHAQKIMGIGSCFVDNIGQKLHQSKFDISLNPTGIIYNSHSIAKQFSYAKDKESLSLSHIIYSQGKFVHPDFHSSISGQTAEECLLQIQMVIKQMAIQLQQVDVLMLTLGTALVYKTIADNQIVANCHKRPAKEYRKELLTVDEIFNNLEQIEASLPEHAQMLITVSPVRHTKDGLVENQRSKARLIEAVHSFSDNSQSVHYFPAYEIMMDDLRDYRFYTDDLVHPSPMAIGYIWTLFQSAVFGKQVQDFVTQLDAIHAAINHRPFNEDSNEHRSFRDTFYKKVEKLQRENPALNFEKEIQFFK